MMFFSKSCEYALRATLFLARNRDQKKTGVQYIAEELNVPMHYLNKVMQTLVKNNIVSSSKGRNGGFYLTDEEINLPLINVVHAIDGKDVFDQCGLGLKECSNAHPCPLHDDIKAYRENLKLALSENSIEVLSEGVSDGKTFLAN
jgi:Rrf2 family protein